MDWVQIIFKSAGGLGLFLMGMKIMSEGMQKTAGDRLRKILNFLTSNRFIGIAVGFLITAIIQSSSATTVMTVGFVNASLMSLEQAIGIILGANIGTTVTGWIVSLKIVKYSLPIIAVGVGIKFFTKKQRAQYIGEVIFGFGLLFLGMETMKTGFAPLKNSPEFIAMFKNIDGKEYFSVMIGVSVGAISTLLVQSSSAVVGITIALASQGLINYEGAIAVVLGGNIGTTITAILASIGASHTAKRTALAHTLFNSIGVILMLAGFYPFVSLVDQIVPGNPQDVDAIMPHIAMAHTLFNVLGVVIFIPFVGQLAYICERIIKTPAVIGEGLASRFANIDKNLLETPVLGIAEVEKELEIMSGIVVRSFDSVKNVVLTKNDFEKNRDEILKNEAVIDDYQRYITLFLSSLSSHALSYQDALLVGNYSTFAHNLEKYADYMEHLILIFDKVRRNKLDISDLGRKTIIAVLEENIKFYKNSLAVFGQKKSFEGYMEEAIVWSRKIKNMIKDAKFQHFKRLKKNECNKDVSIFYIDILNNLQGMRSEAFNISEIVTNTKY